MIRELPERAAGRLRLLCATFLHKSYPRLARPPVNLEMDELLGGVVAGLLTALRTTRPADRAPVLRPGLPAHALAAQ
jgi:RNA polymerase sigma-70 factor (ECF subfamily)